MDRFHFAEASGSTPPAATDARRALSVLLVLALGGVAAGCSSIQATNYLKAEWKHRPFAGCQRNCAYVDPSECSVACARVPGQPGGEVQIDGKGGSHMIAYGPCLLPAIPQDRPLLASESIDLNIRLDFRSLAGAGSAGPVRVFKSSFEARFADGERLMPRGVSFSEVDADGLAVFHDYASNSTEYGEVFAESYDLPAHSQVELPYSRTFYDTEWIEIRLQVAVRTGDGRYLPVELPAVRMRPARDYDYTPFVIPLYFGPVR
ncbi:MAG: hypothetical protein NXI24_19070 [bacterium]|nr:hypothetical protein [bacterium]